MSASVDARTAAVILRILAGDPRVGAEALDWRLIGGIARREYVAQRVARRLARRGVRLPPRFGDAVARHRDRSGHILALASRIGETCARQGIAHVFLKLAQHYPDVGNDVDLLIAGESGADTLVLDQIPALPGRRSLGGWIDGRTVYAIPQHQTAIDVHHGRLGRFGEHRRVAALLLRRRQTVVLGRAACSVPSLEDQMLLQALAQGAGRSRLSLGDVSWVIGTVRDARLDWNDVLAAAKAAGLLECLSCRLHYVDQIHRDVFDRPLLDRAIRARLPGKDWGLVEYRDGGFRFATTRVSGRLYLQQFRAEVAAGDWEAAGRLCLIPVAAVSAGLRRISGPHRRQEEP